MMFVCWFAMFMHPCLSLVCVGVRNCSWISLVGLFLLVSFSRSFGILAELLSCSNSLSAPQSKLLSLDWAQSSFSTVTYSITMKLMLLVGKDSWSTKKPNLSWKDKNLQYTLVGQFRFAYEFYFYHYVCTGPPIVLKGFLYECTTIKNRFVLNYGNCYWCLATFWVTWVEYESWLTRHVFRWFWIEKGSGLKIRYFSWKKCDFHGLTELDFKFTVGWE